MTLPPAVPHLFRPTTPICHLNGTWVSFLLLQSAITKVRETDNQLAAIMEMTIDRLAVDGEWPKC